MYERVAGETCDALIWREKPKPPAVERQRVRRAEVLKRLRWTDAELRLATDTFGFPVGMQVLAPGTWSTDLVWFEDQIDRWVGERRENIAQQTALIKHWK